MKAIKILSLFLCVSCFLTVFSGCKSKTADNYVYFNVETKPVSLDPQTASTEEELLIVRNIFEGLLRKNEKGEIVNGACKSYTKSGLTYTFSLRDGAVWSDKTPLTANDFVFGLRRAVTPNVKATFANRLLSIKNAKEVLSGSLPAESLGVKATSENTLEITLKNEDERFLDALTTSVAMPCNEEFFKKTIGKYGLDAECVLSNGSYFLKKWNPDDFGIRLYRNEKYNGDFYAKNGAVFISNKADETPYDFFTKGSVDCAIVKNKDIASVESLGVNKKSFQNTVWFMTVSNKFSAQTRQAFVNAFSGDVYKDKLPEGFSVATSIYPSVVLDNKSSGTIPPFNKYDLEKAKSLFADVIKNSKDKQFPQSTLYCYESESILPATKAILGHWQKNLCAFINITAPKHPEELSSQLIEKDVDFALFPITAKSSDKDEYLKNFGKSGLEMITANNVLLSDNTLIPVAYEDTNICYSNQLENLYCDFENGYIDFSFATKL